MTGDLNLSSVSIWISENKSWLFDGLWVFIITTIVWWLVFFWKKISSKNTLSSVKSTTKIEKTKENTSILFIDDKPFPIVENLKTYNYTIQSVKDITSLEDPKVKTADIFFVDIQGVGKKLCPHNQWFWLVQLLKDRFGNSKKIAIYSWEDWRLNPISKLADDILDKDAGLLEFKSAIDSLIKKLNG